MHIKVMTTAVPKANACHIPDTVWIFYTCPLSLTLVCVRIRPRSQAMWSRTMIRMCLRAYCVNSFPVSLLSHLILKAHERRAL